MAAPKLLSPQIKIHQVLERGKAVTVKLPVYRDGALHPPSSGTYTLLDEGGNKVIDAQAVTITDSIAEYDIAAIALPTTKHLSDGWLEKWSLVGGDGYTYDFQRTAALARTSLYPVISDDDFTILYSDLASIRPASLTSYQNVIDESWYQLIQRIRMQGNIEYLILDSQALRQAHINLALYLIFRDMDIGMGEGRWFELAKEHQALYEAEYNRINFRYDEDQDGQLDDSRRRAIRPIMYTSAPPARYRRW